ncbi:MULTISPECIES: MNIO class RiPP chryseobasin precursor ChrA [Chryseobacterium]|uniref:MNIO class RiPP chryseobasin precursor ChrA n=1 Tax=Chryseobacterium TaxID=59732 RepID=UPI001BEBD13D|nr:MULTISPECIES: hypothetical protein [Chryseobacterium]MBT2619817.1 hypothetical protein [Chryseobacterium sp. ISL-6]
MKIPALLMAGLVTVSLSAQTTTPTVKKTKKPIKKVRKAEVPKSNTRPIAKKDTILRGKNYPCVACGMG